MKVRLRGLGSNQGIGRIEVYSSRHAQWGTVCDDLWDIRDARVVCRQLGYADAVQALQGSQVPDGTGTIALDDVRCNGSESSLLNCSHRGWGIHNCVHREDAGVQCRANVSGISVNHRFSLNASCNCILNFGKTATTFKTIFGLIQLFLRVRGA